MRLPRNIDSALSAIGQHCLSGVLVAETPTHRYPVGLQFDVWRVLVTVRSETPFTATGGWVHVDLSWGDLAEADERHDDDARLDGTLAQAVRLIGLEVEEAVENGDCEWEGDEPLQDATLLDLIERSGQGAFDVSGGDLLPEDATGPTPEDDDWVDYSQED